MKEIIIKVENPNPSEKDNINTWSPADIVNTVIGVAVIGGSIGAVSFLVYKIRGLEIGRNLILNNLGDIARWMVTTQEGMSGIASALAVGSVAGPNAALGAGLNVPVLVNVLNRAPAPEGVPELVNMVDAAASTPTFEAALAWDVYQATGSMPAALAAVAMVAGIASVWVMLLRRQVTRQLAVIEKKLQAEAATEERHRIAREFHDTLEQDLAGISLRLDAAAHRAADERSRHVLEEQRGLLARLQSETHDFLWDLRDPARHDGSLLESLAAQVAYLRSLTTVPIRFDSAGDLPRVPSLVQYQLLRVMREAVNNALKHADAAAIEVRVASGPDGLCLTVTDDGIGFDVAVRELLDGHFGIRGIRERARRIGATTAIESHSGRGTHVTIVVPPSRLVVATESALSEPTMATAGAAGDHGHTNAIGKT